MLLQAWKAKDPSEVVRRGYNWIPRLNGATILNSVIVIISAAGTSLVEQSWTADMSVATIAGGLDAQEAVYQITITTSDGQTLEATVTLPIVDTRPKSVASTALSVLQTKVKEAEASYHKLMIGGMPVEFVDQNGEKVVYDRRTAAKLQLYIESLKYQIGRLTGQCGSGPLNVWM